MSARVVFEPPREEEVTETKCVKAFQRLPKPRLIRCSTAACHSSCLASCPVSTGGGPFVHHQSSSTDIEACLLDGGNGGGGWFYEWRRGSRHGPLTASQCSNKPGRSPAPGRSRLCRRLQATRGGVDPGGCMAPIDTYIGCLRAATESLTTTPYGELTNTNCNYRW